MANPYAEFQSSGSKADPYAEFRSGDAAPPISLSPGTPNSGAAGRFAENFASAVNPVPGLMQMGKEAADPTVGLKKTLERHFIAPQMDQFSKAKDAITGSGEFSGMGPMGRASEAIGHGAAGMIPLAGPAAANAGDQIGNGDVAGGLGSGAGLIATMAAPEMLKATGRGLQKTAEPIIGNALGVRHIDRAFAKTPERAALDETTGFTPGAVAESARARLGDLTAQLKGLYNSTGKEESIQPARGVIEKKITQALGGNSKKSPPELRQMLENLTEPGPGFAGATEYPQGAATPITINQAKLPSGGINPFGAPTVTPGAAPELVISGQQKLADILDLKHWFGKDHTRWNPLHPNGEMGTAREAYGALDKALDKGAPEGAQLNQRISSLIPIAQHAENTALKASGSQRALGRLAKPTGALVAPSAGFMAGGVPGAIAGLVLPELLSSPTAQIAAARGINGAGKAIQSPFVTRPAQASPFIKKRDEQK